MKKTAAKINHIAIPTLVIEIITAKLESLKAPCRDNQPAEKQCNKRRRRTLAISSENS